MNKYQRQACKAKVPDIEGAWIIVSASKREVDYGGYYCKAGMSFLYDNGSGLLRIFSTGRSNMTCGIPFSSFELYTVEEVDE